MLLTTDERAVVDMLGGVWNQLCSIVGDGPARDADLHEASIHVHALQNMVLAQAAARAFPDEFRLLGTGGDRWMTG